MFSRLACLSLFQQTPLVVECVGVLATLRRLNGWQRIGIIASFVWIAGAYIYLYNSGLDLQRRALGQQLLFCESAGDNRPETEAQAIFRDCQSKFFDSMLAAESHARLKAAELVLVPVPLGWGVAYLLIFLVRWVKRGFNSPAKASQ